MSRACGRERGRGHHEAARTRPTLRTLPYLACRSWSQARCGLWRDANAKSERPQGPRLAAVSHHARDDQLRRRDEHRKGAGEDYGPRAREELDPAPSPRKSEEGGRDEQDGHDLDAHRHPEGSPREPRRPPALDEIDPEQDEEDQDRVAVGVKAGDENRDRGDGEQSERDLGLPIPPPREHAQEQYEVP